MHLQITFNQQSSISDLVITPDQLSLFRYNTFTTITLNHQIDFQIAVEISHLLKDNGILNYNIDKSQNTITLLEACGLYLQGDGIYIKKNLEITRLLIQEQSLKNSYGIYDYIEQRFINNPFKQIQTIQQEIIDENELLDDGIEVKKIESCASKPRACANCTCGRKEMEDQEDRDQLLNQLQSGTVQSSCGSCYLGDAFRCANCPYRGLPAFKEGEQVKVLQNDVLQDEIQKNEVNVDNGKVKLKI